MPSLGSPLQARIAELPLDCYRMTLALEWDDLAPAPTAQDAATQASIAANLAASAGFAPPPAPAFAQPPPANPCKQLVYKQTATQLMATLLHTAEAMPSRRVLLLYLAANPPPPPAGERPMAGSLFSVLFVHA